VTYSEGWGHILNIKFWHLPLVNILQQKKGVVPFFYITTFLNKYIEFILQ